MLISSKQWREPASYKVGSENQHLRLVSDHRRVHPTDTMLIAFSRVLYQLTSLNRKGRLFNFAIDCMYSTAFVGDWYHKWKAILTLRRERVRSVCELTLSVVDPSIHPMKSEDWSPASYILHFLFLGGRNPTVNFMGDFAPSILCLFICICVYMCICAHVYACTYGWQKKSSVIISQVPIVYSSLSRTDWVTLKPQGSTCFHLQSFRCTNMHHHDWPF